MSYERANSKIEINHQYITSPIFYPNDDPHIGTAYTLILCDILARFYRMENYRVFFLTGTDEHGQKVQNAAIKREIPVRNHILEKRDIFLQIKNQLNISFDFFIGTDEEFHRKRVAKIWKMVQANGYIYKGKYSGWYSERDETFYQDKELVNGLSPYGSSVVFMEDECYFFKLSSFSDKLLEFYEKNPDFICQKGYMKQIISNVQGGLNDVCISRDVKKLDWGIKVPEDDTQTIYVWFDALINYLSAMGYPDNEVQFNKFWSNSLHVLGKDIVFFHGILWPAMLMAMELNPPKQMLVHGWLTVEGQKMSKSLNNVVRIDDMCAKYSRDTIRFFLIREISIGSDGNFSEANVANRLNNEFANNVGNLVNRVLKFIEKHFDSCIPSGNFDKSIIREHFSNYIPNNTFNKTEIEKNFYLNDLFTLETFIKSKMYEKNINEYLNLVLQLSHVGNLYFANNEPWKVIKENREEVQNVIYTCTMIVLTIAKLLYPVTPDISNNIFKQLSIENSWHLDNDLNGVILGNVMPIVEKI